MAAATTLLTAGALAAGAATTASGAISAGKTKKELNNYKRQDLKNYAEDMQISTAGSDLMREESARTTNTLINNVTRGGSRAINENLGKIVSFNNRSNQQAAFEIDKQYQDRNRMVAMENSRIQDMYERREEGDIAGLGQKLQADRQTMWNGISAMQNSAMYAANTGMFEGGGSNPGVGPVSQTIGGSYSRPSRFRAPVGAFSRPDNAFQSNNDFSMNNNTEMYT